VPWIRALLRGQRVLARADDQGRLAEAAGKVEIRYKPSDGRRYDAMARNLIIEPGATVLPEDTCAPAEAVVKPSGDAAATTPGAAAAASAKKRPGGRGTKVAASGAAGVASRELALEGAKSGEMVVLDAGAREELGEYLGTGTNNIAELTAVLRALELVEDRSRPLLVHTDSQYAIGVLTKGWKAKANAELIAGIREALKGHPKARLVYVPGHSGVAWNERADELARAAVVQRKTTRKRVEAAPSVEAAKSG
jgi:ribonuclease HI